MADEASSQQSEEKATVARTLSAAECEKLFMRFLR
jgi:hypothetical protein